MTVRFLADEDLDQDIIDGLKRREPAIDILDAKRTVPRKGDSFLLELAFAEGRILISHDRRTMTHHFLERQRQGRPNPGLFIVRQGQAIGEVIESLLLVWSASSAEEWRDGIQYLPFR